MKTEQPNMKQTKEIPQYAIDKLPGGYTILGYGGEFECNEDFLGLAILPNNKKDTWDEDYYRGSEDDLILAAPTDSEIVRINKDKLMLSSVAKPKPIFPEDASERKTYPVGTFICDYFPLAIAELAHHSYVSQQQHGPASNGAPMEWLKDKSVGDSNQIVRHLMEGDLVSTAWRALELLERELTQTK